MAKKRRAGKKPPSQLGRHERVEAGVRPQTPTDTVIAPYRAFCGDSEPHLPHLWQATFEYPAQCMGVRPSKGVSGS